MDVIYLLLFTIALKLTAVIPHNCSCKNKWNVWQTEKQQPTNQKWTNDLTVILKCNFEVLLNFSFPANISMMMTTFFKQYCAFYIWKVKSRVLFYVFVFFNLHLCTGKRPGTDLFLLLNRRVFVDNINNLLWILNSSIKHISIPSRVQQLEIRISHIQIQ